MVEVCLGGVEGDCFGEIRDGCLEVFVSVVGDASVVVGERVVGLDFEGCGVVLDGLGVLFEFVVSESSVEIALEILSNRKGSILEKFLFCTISIFKGGQITFLVFTLK